MYKYDSLSSTITPVQESIKLKSKYLELKENIQNFKNFSPKSKPVTKDRNFYSHKLNLFVNEIKNVKNHIRSNNFHEIGFDIEKIRINPELRDKYKCILEYGLSNVKQRENSN